MIKYLEKSGRTMEEAEASDVLRQIREMGIFPEAVIVKSKINVRM